MRKSRKPKHFLQTPQYPGGKTAMAKFINENLLYPEEAQQNKIEGTVEAEYFINGLGNITSVNILKGLGSGCDEEVKRVIKLLVFEKAVNRGMKSSTRKTLKINFKLPKKKKPLIKYNLVKKILRARKCCSKTSGIQHHYYIQEVKVLSHCITSFGKLISLCTFHKYFLPHSFDVGLRLGWPKPSSLNQVARDLMLLE